MRQMATITGTSTAVFVMAATGLILVGLAELDSANAQSQGSERGLKAALSARGQVRLRPRPRTRIRVTPAYPYRLAPSIYPIPYTYEYPGPGAVRQCTSWLAQELRPSGPVIVPKMHCSWVRG